MVLLSGSDSDGGNKRGGYWKEILSVFSGAELPISVEIFAEPIGGDGIIVLLVTSVLFLPVYRMTGAAPSFSAALRSGVGGADAFLPSPSADEPPDCFL